ncbi:PREDICTED: uncharacterized protein LOC107068893 isoform X2 [Polistes dominula]|uniref:Centromere protein L n=1 Tax=Polistes dominula TaxID=743375 RepID=A0ABM1ILX0_POLDO|nr:PREDICTED: uncharacterized protein LOC107068893 isoform X2 [Polistes dominula]
MMEISNSFPSTSQQILQAPQCTPRLTFTIDKERLDDDINTYSQGDTTTNQPSIKVEVFAKKSDKDEQKSIYKGFFLSWKKNDISNNNTTRFPLLLCRGSRPCMNIVHSTFNRMFDCLIIKLPIEEDDLIWLLAIIIVPVNDNDNLNKNKDVTLEFKVPGLPINNTISVLFKILDLINILNAIIENQSDQMETDISELTIEQIQRFRKCLYTQIKNIAGLELGLCSLHRISLPAATIMGNKMKIMDPYCQKRILSYMMEKSVDMFHAFL